MDKREAKKLLIGDPVVFSDGVKGKVTEKNWMAVKIEWDDGQIGIIHLNDMQDVSRVVLV